MGSIASDFQPKPPEYPVTHLKRGYLSIGSTSDDGTFREVLNYSGKGFLHSLAGAYRTQGGSLANQDYTSPLNFRVTIDGGVTTSFVPVGISGDYEGSSTLEVLRAFFRRTFVSTVGNIRFVESLLVEARGSSSSNSTYTRGWSGTVIYSTE